MTDNQRSPILWPAQRVVEGLFPCVGHLRPLQGPPHPVTSSSSSSNFGATGFISLSCFVSGFRVVAMTCVTAGCARTFANAFRPTNPVAPRIRTFIANTQLSCKLSQVIIQVNLQELTHSFGVILPNIGYGFHASAVLAFQSASKIFSSCAFSYANCPIRARHLHPPTHRYTSKR